MTPEQRSYCKALRARHKQDRAEIRAALGAGQAGVLKELKRRHWLVEQETYRILERVTREHN